jgi:hypothetical protein
MSVENCEFGTDCTMMADVYLLAATKVELALSTAAPNSTAELEDALEPTAEADEATKYAEVFHGPLTDAMFGRFAKVGGLESDCLACPIRKICFDHVQEYPPIDPDTGELLA